MENLEMLINERMWDEIITKSKVLDLCNSLSFKEALALAYRMLYDPRWDEKFQNYAVELLYAIRKHFPEDWDSSWKFDVFLGDACNIAMRYEEKYQAYKRAAEKVTPIPPSLLVLIAECYISPGTPPIAQTTAEELLKEALQKEKSIEGASLLKRIYERRQDVSQVAHWDTILKVATKQNAHIKVMQPDFLNDLKL